MSADYLSYWRPDTVDAVLGDTNQLLGHSASAQYNRVEPGDTVWIVTTWQSGQLILLGRIIVDQRVDKETAARILGTDDLWDAPFHILAAPGQEEVTREVDLTDLAPQLRFESSHDRLDVVDRAVNPQQLQSMRRLTPEAAELLRKRWDEDRIFTHALLDVAVPPIGAPIGGGFGDSATNRKVEGAAVAHVIRALEEDGWDVRSVEQDCVGYDLLCTKGDDTRHVEVKGTRGAGLSFIITANELNRAIADDDFWLAVVTDALSATPNLHQFNADEVAASFNFQPLAYRAVFGSP